MVQITAYFAVVAVMTLGASSAIATPYPQRGASEEAENIASRNTLDALYPRLKGKPTGTVTNIGAFGQVSGQVQQATGLQGLVSGNKKSTVSNTRKSVSAGGSTTLPKSKVQKGKRAKRELVADILERVFERAEELSARTESYPHLLALRHLATRMLAGRDYYDDSMYERDYSYDDWMFERESFDELD